MTGRVEPNVDAVQRILAEHRLMGVLGSETSAVCTCEEWAGTIWDEGGIPHDRHVAAAIVAALPTPCPTCGGAGIVDTSPPGLEKSAP